MNVRLSSTALLTALLVAALTWGCGGERGKTNPAADLIRDVASEASAKPRVQAIITIAGQEPTPEELTLLRSLEDTIERKGLGRLVASGTQPGSIYVSVEVQNTADAMTDLRAIVLDAGVLKRTSFRVLPPA